MYKSCGTYLASELMSL